MVMKKDTLRSEAVIAFITLQILTFLDLMVIDKRKCLQKHIFMLEMSRKAVVTSMQIFFFSVYKWSFSDEKM